MGLYKQSVLIVNCLKGSHFYFHKQFWINFPRQRQEGSYKQQETFTFMGGKAAFVLGLPWKECSLVYRAQYLQCPRIPPVSNPICRISIFFLYECPQCHSRYSVNMGIQLELRFSQLQKRAVFNFQSFQEKRLSLWCFTQCLPCNFNP